MSNTTEQLPPVLFENQRCESQTPTSWVFGSSGLQQHVCLGKSFHDSSMTQLDSLLSAFTDHESLMKHWCILATTCTTYAQERLQSASVGMLSATANISDPTIRSSQVNSRRFLRSSSLNCGFRRGMNRSTRQLWKNQSSAGSGV